MAQNEQMMEEHSTLEQQPPGRLDHPAWCVVWMVQPASMLKHSEDADVSLHRQSGQGSPYPACRYFSQQCQPSEAVCGSLQLSYSVASFKQQLK